MAIASYSELKTKIKLWAERQDISDDLLDDFIFMTESTAMNNLRVPAMENTELLPVADSTVTIPFDFLQLRALSGPDSTNGNVYRILPWEDFVEYFHGQSQATTQSTSERFYARQGARWFLFPQVADGEELVCHYYRTFTQLTDLQPTNWLLELSPQSYLFGCLKHLYEFLMDQERADYWENKFMRELSIIQDMADKSEHRGSQLVVQPTSIGSVT